MLLTRRQLLGSSLLLGAGAATAELPGCGSSKAATEACPNSARALPLAQDFTIAARLPEDGRLYYMHDPGMALLPSGHILVAAPCLEKSRETLDELSHRTFMRRSSDGGRTWDELPTLPFHDATPFVFGGQIHMFVQREKWQGVWLTSTPDEGQTWRDPVELFHGAYWNCDTALVLERGRLHWAVQNVDYSSGVAVIVADPTRNLLDPAAWRMSSLAQHPQTPPALVRGLYPGMIPIWKEWPQDGWLEPNIVSVGGRIRVLLRTVLDGYATAGACAVCDLDDANGAFELRFTQFYPIPGGQQKFYVLYDAPSQLFWMLSNLVTDSQEMVLDWNAIRQTGRFTGGPGNERRFLMLSYSLDALNWFPAGCVARAPGAGQSFMYPAADVDGDDLIFISRTSIEGRNQHDADHVTFHRVRGFRALAMGLRPEF